MGGPFILLRKLVLLAFIGFASLLLIGPIVALIASLLSFGLVLLSLALPFAVVGLLVWVPVRLFSSGAWAAWKDMHATGKTMGRVTLLPLRGCARVAAGTARLRQGAHCGLAQASRALNGARRGGRWVWESRSRLSWVADFLGGIVVECFSGALVGLLFGGIASWQYQAGEGPAWLGLAVGALLGLAVAVTRRQAERGPAGSLPYGPLEPAAHSPDGSACGG
jgi:hypothetical protein